MVVGVFVFDVPRRRFVVVVVVVVQGRQIVVSRTLWIRNCVVVVVVGVIAVSKTIVVVGRMTIVLSTFKSNFVAA